MPILARTPTPVSCRSDLPSCGPVSFEGPGPAMVNNAVANTVPRSAAQSVPIPLPDPTDRNPDAALNSYVSHLGPELIVGITFVVVIALVGIILWIRFDEDTRKFVKRWWAAAFKKRAPAAKAQMQATKEVPASPGARSDVTRVNTPTKDIDMRSATDVPVRPPLAVPEAAASRTSLTKIEQINALPTLLSRA